jgi:3D (Asp-Asp-Asp) domain-containing protein
MNYKKIVRIYLVVMFLMIIVLFLSFVNFNIISKTIYPELVAFDVSMDSASVDSIPEVIAEPEVETDGTGAIPLRAPLLSLDKEWKGMVKSVSAYNAGDITQCSGNPCISASGDNICELLNQGTNICAANWVSLGTVLEVEGMGKCIVLDRMANPNNVDWAMKKDEVAEAFEFGRRNLRVWIIN